MTLSTPVDAFTVERAAEAAYHAAMTMRGDNMIHEDWANLSAYADRVPVPDIAARFGITDRSAYRIVRDSKDAA